MKFWVLIWSGTFTEDPFNRAKCQTYFRHQQALDAYNAIELNNDIVVKRLLEGEDITSYSLNNCQLNQLCYESNQGSNQ